HTPGLVGCDGGAFILDRVMHHAVYAGQLWLPVALVFHQLDRDVLDELAGLEGPGTHGVLPFLDICTRLGPALGDDLAEVQGKGRQEVGRIRDFEGYFHSVVINGPRSALLVIRAQRRQGHRTSGLGVRVYHAVDGVDHILGGDRRAVLPLGLWV